MGAAVVMFIAWSNFYVIIGSSAASLTGLMFVVVTLVAGSRLRERTDRNEGFATFNTPTVVHFCAAFLVAGIVSAPWRSLTPVSVLLGITGLCGVVYVCRVMYRAKRLTAYQAVAEDWLWHAILPCIDYAAIAASAVLLSCAPEQAKFALAGSTILLIFIGIHNAWDVVTYIAIEQSPDQ